MTCRIYYIKIHSSNNNSAQVMQDYETLLLIILAEMTVGL